MLALKTFLTRLSLVEDSLKKIKQPLGALKSCIDSKKKKKREKERENSRPLRKATSLLAVGEFNQCVRCTRAAPASTEPEGLFYFG